MSFKCCIDLLLLCYVSEDLYYPLSLGTENKKSSTYLVLLKLMANTPFHHWAGRHAVYKYLQQNIIWLKWIKFAVRQKTQTFCTRTQLIFCTLTSNVNCCSTRYNLFSEKHSQYRGQGSSLGSFFSSLQCCTLQDVYVYLHKHLQAEENTLFMQTLFLFEKIYLY